MSIIADGHYTVGHYVRRMRIQAEATVRELASTTNLSESFLSQSDALLHKERLARGENGGASMREKRGRSLIGRSIYDLRPTSRVVDEL